jgi:hypothetical protein
LDSSDFEKLNSIFLPHAMARQQEVLGTNRRFVHYTSAENAIKIIHSKEIWLRSVRCMSDYMEVSHGYQLLQRFFTNQERKKEFDDALEPCAAGIEAEAISIFDKWWISIQFGTYICSISEHLQSEDLHGRLSMWRAFGRPTARAAIVLNLPGHSAAIGLNLTLSPVAYFSYEQVESELLRVISGVRENCEYLKSIDRQTVLHAVFFMLMVAAVSLKHEGFHEEREWRLVYSPQLRPSAFLRKATETIDGVPQIVYKIPLENKPAENIVGVEIPELIERIIIGPSNYPIPIGEAFTAALQDAGMKDAAARVFASSIPLRT